MLLTNGPGGGGGGGYNNAPNGQSYGNYGNGNGSGGGAGSDGGGGRNSVCYNCGKTGHFAWDCWSRRGRGYGAQQGDPELEEMKEHFRQLRRERQELKEKRKLEEERKAREEDELRRNQDFARKAEEFKMQLHAELLEEWRRINTEVKEAVGKTRRSTKKHTCKSGGGTKRKGRRYSKKKRKEEIPSEEMESDDTSDEDRNVTRPAKASNTVTMAKAVLAATRHLKVKETPMVDSSEIWITEQGSSTTWKDDEVLSWKRRFDGLVLSPIDRNQGDTAVMCPILYRHGFGKTLTWNTNYETKATAEEEVLRESREDFKKSGLPAIGSWRSDGRLGTAYVIPKHKDLTRWRPIATAPVDPAAMTQRRLARALHQMLKRLPANNTFYLNSISELTERLAGTAVRFRAAGCDQAIERCYDIKDMFSRILHEAVIQAVHQLLRIYDNKGSKQVRVSRRGRNCVIRDNKR
ncbi:hypothetical protein CBR_g4677 [Chara braunii]|uniref:CCHC-type domain-containing protein n=1 Tax=Chara braunii TaxID=69332 RepID=A0A388KIK7_CHABU|nr:hypothetical protein CBR_g4677 [Chara braunii]|eukprot:GBG69848.1 hypothetical protein CBR_g4677 [Chara braunii]